MQLDIGFSGVTPQSFRSEAPLDLVWLRPSIAVTP
jgi:hypothetical protein